MWKLHSLEEWAAEFRDMIDSATNDGYAVYANESGDDIFLMIGYTYPDHGDEDIVIADITI